MINRTLPYCLEDRTGHYMGTDFDEIYDRLFLRIARPSPSQVPHSSETTLMIYNTGRRSSSHRLSRPPSREPSAILDFGLNGTLGTIWFAESGVSMPIGQYLRKTSMFAGSLSRKFTAMNGEEYRWIHRAVKDYEWSCVDSRDYVVAHYHLKPPEKPAYNTSGNVLTIYEPFTHLSIEILATLTIMRHLAAGKY
ncbi:hypothetical protein BD309DRAFT_948763 [Dichomitus squalens]|uniref:DUF6593 domain-containing protein n=2 Tax=Dichomitus squalens TaxID=114155 RepID=A0A4Q9M6N7_9APHY|nr:uncharacterized protein DICSQDRAFT_88461 [Dichomitus squalens LYAD-421 SS1]EJF60006.1 hypothetical protein DICSQDRAFT_88461 [Dichomitus squalens LYAD-421 SS1]TBU22684.1 hypothetical protein BD311DRAFT_742866 [Dichomitus squalens]TBU48746.1 hypothetical protein BD309DRAFT_948763 [Dichomitus squalens]TBU57798.1 hypothetical protein BD310DRAFT_928367 [Dichomitus squalens]